MSEREINREEGFRVKEDKTFLSYLMDLTIIGLVFLVCFCIYNYVDNLIIKYGLMGFFLLGGIIVVFNIAITQEVKGETKGGIIHKICLLNEEEDIITEWNLFGETSLVIGKNTDKIKVDVELSECEYSSLIAPQHAILNFASDRWYIEDIAPEYSISIQKENDSMKYRIASGRPCKIDKGDVIFISNTKLLIG